ncbi:MAG: thiamine pyrophosphate-dependent enzyme [Acidiferrobacter sp.]
MNREILIAVLRDMLLARAFEERVAQEYTQGNIAGFLHLYPGEEAVAVGVLHAAEPSDYIVTTYREHVHAIVRGIPPRRVMAELFGKKEGVSGGMGGSMHLFDRQQRFMGGYAIVGETFPVAIGIGYAIAYRKQPEVVICFFGDGAVNQGTFHESLNMAALWKLPILFACENNRYQIGTEIHRHSAITDVYKRACSYGIPAEKVDGMDARAVYEATRRGIERIQAAEGPQLIEFETYRYRGHSMADPGTTRPPDEIKAFINRDPIGTAVYEMQSGYPSADQLNTVGPDCVTSFAEHCCAQGHLDEAGVARMKKEVTDIVIDAVDFARNSPEPTMDDARAAFVHNRRFETLL